MLRKRRQAEVGEVSDAQTELALLREENARLKADAALARPVDDALARMRATTEARREDEADDAWLAIAQARALSEALIELAAGLETAAGHVREQLAAVFDDLDLSTLEPAAARPRSTMRSTSWTRRDDAPAPQRAARPARPLRAVGGRTGRLGVPRPALRPQGAGALGERQRANVRGLDRPARARGRALRRRRRRERAADHDRPAAGQPDALALRGRDPGQRRARRLRQRHVRVGALPGGVGHAQRLRGGVRHPADHRRDVPDPRLRAELPDVLGQLRRRDRHALGRRPGRPLEVPEGDRALPGRLRLEGHACRPGPLRGAALRLGRLGADGDLPPPRRPRRARLDGRREPVHAALPVAPPRHADVGDARDVRRAAAQLPDVARRRHLPRRRPLGPRREHDAAGPAEPDPHGGRGRRARGRVAERDGPAPGLPLQRQGQRRRDRRARRRPADRRAARAQERLHVDEPHVRPHGAERRDAPADRGADQGQRRLRRAQRHRHRCRASS